MKHQMLEQYQLEYLSRFQHQQMERLLLVTDRCQADMEVALALCKKIRQVGVEKLTPLEQLQWFCGLKAAFNQEDICRVARALQRLSRQLAAGGYLAPCQTPVDWEESSMLWEETLEGFLAEVKNLGQVFCFKPSTPALPPDLAVFDWRQANALEQALSDVQDLLETMEQVYCYCGDACCST